MAHFAKIDNNNTVTAVHVVNNQVILDSEGNESELIGQQFLNSLHGTANWVQTSYNGNFRKQYAGIGYTYNETNDVFITPQPYPSWTLNNNNDWQPPTPRPEGIDWYWSESVLAWTEHPDKPYPSWIYNEEKKQWIPPVDYPENYYLETWNWIWNEETLTWVEK